MLYLICFRLYLLTLLNNFSRASTAGPHMYNVLPFTKVGKVNLLACGNLQSGHKPDSDSPRNSVNMSQQGQGGKKLCYFAWKCPSPHGEQELLLH